MDIEMFKITLVKKEAFADYTISILSVSQADVSMTLSNVGVNIDV